MTSSYTCAKPLKYLFNKALKTAGMDDKRSQLFWQDGYNQVKK